MPPPPKTNENLPSSEFPPDESTTFDVSDSTLLDEVFLHSNKRPHGTGDTSSILGETSSILPPPRRARLMDSIPDNTLNSLNMPPPVSRSSMSKSKLKEIPKTTRKTRSQTQSLTSLTNP